MPSFALTLLALLLTACSLDTAVIATDGDAQSPTDAAEDSTPPRPDTSVSDAGRDTNPPPADTSPDTALPPPTDAGVDTAVMPPLASDCDGPLSSAIFCDGFEDPSLSSWMLLTTRSGTVEQSTTSPLRGNGALRASITERRDRGQAFTDALGDIGSGDLYFRAWYFMPAGGPTSLAFAILQEGSSPWHHMSFNGAEGGTDFSVWAAGPDVGFASPVPLPVDRWFCVRAHIEVDGSEGSVTTWIDETVAAQRSGFDTRPGDGYASISVGIPWASSPQDAYSVYVDEVAVDDTPIPCSF